MKTFWTHDNFDHILEVLSQDSCITLEDTTTGVDNFNDERISPMEELKSIQVRYFNTSENYYYFLYDSEV